MRTRIGVLTIFALLPIAAAQFAATASARSENEITIQQDGSVTWYLMPLNGDRELIERLERARKAKQELHVTATPNARYDAVAHVMAIVQHCKCYKFGIILAAPSDRK